MQLLHMTSLLLFELSGGLPFTDEYNVLGNGEFRYLPSRLCNCAETQKSPSDFCYCAKTKVPPANIDVGQGSRYDLHGHYVRIGLAAASPAIWAATVWSRFKGSTAKHATHIPAPVISPHVA